MGNTIVQAMCWSILSSYFGKKIYGENHCNLGLNFSHKRYEENIHESFIFIVTC